MASRVAQEFYESVIEDLEKQRLLLPTLPEVALRVREVADDPASGCIDIARIVSSDPALSARLIRVANSALLRGSYQLDSIEGAVTRLGNRLVRDLVIGMAMEQMFQATEELTDKLLRETWEQSTQVAAICQVLAAQFTTLQPERAMLAGLVHDIGMLPLLTRAEETAEVLADAEEFGRLVHLLHPRVGAAILKAWDLPEETVTAAAEHESLERDSPRLDYVDVVIVANLQSRLGTKHPYTRLDWRRVPAFEKLGLSPEVNVVELNETTISEVQGGLRGT